MHRNHLHRVLITLKQQFIVAANLSRRRAAQPLEQLTGLQMPRLLLLTGKSEKLTDVGDHPLTALLDRKALQNLLGMQQLDHHRKKRALLPAPPIPKHPLTPGSETLLISVDPVNIAATEAKPAAGEAGAKTAEITGGKNRLDDQQQLAALFGLPDRLTTQGHRRDPGICKGVNTLSGNSVGADKDRDIPRQQRPSPLVIDDNRLFGDQPADLCRNPSEQNRTRSCRRPPLLRRLRQQPELKTIGRLSAHLKMVALAEITALYRNKREFFRSVEKGSRWTRKEVIDRSSHLRVGAVVFVEGEQGVSRPARGKIAVYIGTAKAVDRLFGVADQKEMMCPVTEQGRKDGVLLTIGILKFIDQCGPKTLRQSMSQQPAVVALQRLGKVVDQRVKAEPAALTQAAVYTGAQPAGKIAADTEHKLTLAITQLLDRRKDPFSAEADSIFDPASVEQLRPRIAEALCRKEVKLLRDRSAPGHLITGAADSTPLVSERRIKKPGRLILLVLAGKAVPVLLPPAAEPALLSVQLRLRRCRALSLLRKKSAAAQTSANRRKQLLRRLRLPAYRRRQQPGGGIEALPPEIIGNLLHHRVDIGNQFSVKRAAALKRPLHQHPLTETVNGEDRRLVDIGNRQPQPQADLPAFRLGDGLCPGGQGRVKLAAAATEDLPALDQPSAYPRPQFGGRRPGVGDDQDAVDLQLTLGNKAEDQHRDRIGLAGSGARLNQMYPRFQRLVYRIEDLNLLRLFHLLPRSPSLQRGSIISSPKR